MRVILIATAFATLLSPAFADDTPLDCDALYQQFRLNAPADLSKCEIKVAEPLHEECTPPQNFSAERPSSNVILALDASGSMAGKSGSETKMVVAKREALAFLNALQNDVPVGLMVYGHRGNNQESGKSESCSATEWAHEIGASKSALAKSIDALQPTGWTPLGGVLAYAKDELERLPKNDDDKVSVPVVYLISDGEETCGGDPVAEARALHESGVRAAINVIGFGVDDETRAQLEAISVAGGGRYFPAEDALALRKQMRAIQDSQASLVRYQYCQNGNRGRVNMVHHDASVELGRCLRREGERNGIYAMLSQIEKLANSDGPEKACAADLKRRAYSDHSKINAIAVEQRAAMQGKWDESLVEYDSRSVFEALEK